MQTPTPKLGSLALRRLGLYHLAALDQFDETRSLIEGFRPVQDAVEAAVARVSAAEDGLIAPRLAIRLRELGTEKQIRRLVGACQIIDGAQQGPTYKVLFPKGLGARIQPVGQAQVAEVDGLFTLAEHRGLLTQETLAPVFTDLRGTRDQLATAVGARKDAYGALAMAQTEEMVAREDFCTAYSRDAGLIRAAYPDDRAMQELFFDTFRKSSSKSDEDEGGEESEGGEG